MRPFRTKPKKETTEITEEQRHYQNMISYFKWALGFTGSMMVLILTAAGILFFKDRTSFNADIKSYLDESKSQIKEMTSDAKITLKDTKEESSRLNYSLKSDAEQSIRYIREDAKSLALSEATKQVNDAFREKNIQKTIEEAAQKEITTSVNERVFNKLKLLPNIFLALVRITNGQRASFFYLDSIARFSKDPYYQAISDSIVNSKRDEYDYNIDDIFCIEMIHYLDLTSDGMFPMEVNNFVGQENLKPDSSETKCRKLFDDAIEDLKYNPNLNHLAFDFKVLRFITGEEIRMFDFDRIKTIQYKEGIKHPYTATKAFRI